MCSSIEEGLKFISLAIGFSGSMLEELLQWSTADTEIYVSASQARFAELTPEYRESHAAVWPHWGLARFADRDVAEVFVRCQLRVSGETIAHVLLAIDRRWASGQPLRVREEFAAMCGPEVIRAVDRLSVHERKEIAARGAAVFRGGRTRKRE